MSNLEKFNMSEKDEIIQSYIASKNELNREDFPLLYNISSGFTYTFVPRPKETKIPEFVYLKPKIYSGNRSRLNLLQWNTLWEAGHIRSEFFSEELSPTLEWLEKYNGHNIYLLPLSNNHKYFAYSSLFHLIPQKTLKKFLLPFLKKGNWPIGFPTNAIDSIISNDFDKKLEKAFAYHIWPLINSGSKVFAFSDTDPIKILAHNLDFWLPHAFKIAENRLKQFNRVPIENEEQKQTFKKLKQGLPHDIDPVRPLMGGSIWQGEEDAWEATKEIVNSADSNGKLRNIIDAIQSNRIEDDFSSIWSYAREDFERKLYRKRLKLKISFVELKETIPVHGPESEVIEKLLWENFIALLDQKEKRIVVCIRNGITRVGEISERLGYANHSPISKALKKIRKKVINYLE